MRSSRWLILVAMSAPSLCFAQASAEDPVIEPGLPAEEVLVTGEYPGPGMWKVTRVDDPENHVLWIVGDPPPLPKKMKWKSKDIEDVARGSQEILFPGALVMEPDERIGFFKGMSLLPAALGVRKNPDKAKLKDVVPADLYTRWLVQKKKYLGRSAGIERWRPLFAAEKLRDKAFARSGLRGDGLVRSVVSELAEEHQIKTTTPTLRFAFETRKIKPILKQFSRERLDDIECFATSLDLTEAISDKETMNARATAWATADLPALAAIPPLPEPSTACATALIESTVVKDILPSDIASQMESLWIDQAEKSFAENRSTFAVLHFSQLTRSDGYLAKLREKGYVVEEPGTE